MNEGVETWEGSDNLKREFVNENLEIESKDITIERAHEPVPK